jgi:hypothetical protein
MRRLVIKTQSLNGSNHGTSTSARYEHRLLPHLPRQRARQRMVQQIENLLSIPSEQSSAESIQKRQHNDSVVFGVIYTL